MARFAVSTGAARPSLQFDSRGRRVGSSVTGGVLRTVLPAGAAAEHEDPSGSDRVVATHELAEKIAATVMRERCVRGLPKVAPHPVSLRIHLLREETDIVRQADHAIHELLRFLAAAGDGEGRPERAICSSAQRRNSAVRIFVPFVPVVTGN
jgi:hypothetical protein